MLHNISLKARLHRHAIFGVVLVSDIGTGTTRWIPVSSKCLFFSLLRHGSDMSNTPAMKKKKKKRKSQILTYQYH